MKSKLLFCVLVSVIASGCGSQTLTGNTPAAKPVSSPTAVVSPTPVPTTFTPKNGDYPGKGVVTKINIELASVEMNHEEIEGVMPAMLMEFYVTDKKMLDGINVGDKVDFVLRYKDHTETIVNHKKTQ